MGLNTSVEYNGNKLSNINNSSSNNNISCSSSAMGLLRSGSEKRIQVNNRGGNNSNVKKVGEILLQRIFNHDNDNGEHNNNAAINSSSSIIDGGVIGNGGNLKDYTPIGNDYGNDLSSLAVHSVPLGRKASSSRLIANNGEEYLSDMDGDVSNMPSRYSSGGGGGRLKKGISNIQPMQHGDKHRQTSRSDHNLLSVSNAKHYNNDGNEAT